MKHFGFIAVLFILCGMCANIYADETGMKITSAEADILNSASADTAYKKGIEIDEDLIDPLVRSAVSKRDEYVNSEAAEWKDLQTNVQINLKGAYKKTEFTLSGGIKNYSDLIDNIIVNCGGIYYYINPSEFAEGISSEGITIKTEDESNVIAKYSGAAAAHYLKLILTAVFGIAAVYAILFALVFIKRISSDNKKVLYVFSLLAAMTAAVLAVIVFAADFSSLIGKKKLDMGDTTSAYFDIEISESNTVMGLQIGIPLFDKGIDHDLSAVVRRSSDKMNGDTVIGGKYSERTDILKFTADVSGEYYIRNNIITFDDISSNEAGLYEAVSVLASKGILSGKSDSVFGGDDSVTRAETVTMLCKMLSLSNDGSSDDFTDVKRDDWYYQYALAAKNGGILSGYDDGSFRGGNTITRQEFAAVLGQIMENRMGYYLPDDISNLSVYEDSGDISFWAEKYISLLDKNDVSIWTGAYYPQQLITRGEAAVLLYRLYLLYD